MSVKRLVLLSLLLVAGVCLAEVSPVAAYAAKEEAGIKTRIEQETKPRRKAQLEYMMRQDYALRLEAEQTKMVRSGTLSTPEVERLKAEREALILKMQELNKAIDIASLEAPEVKELQTVMKANEERLAELRYALMPESLRKAQAPKESNP